MLENHPPEGLPGYSQTKWVSDVLLFKALLKDINPHIRIYRPGTIGSSSVTGHSNLVDFNNRFIQAMIELQSYPSSDAILEMYPVDLMARNIVEISLQPIEKWEHHVFHLVNPKSKTVKELAEWIRSFGIPVQEMSYEYWREKLIQITEKSGKTSPLCALVPYFSSAGYSGGKPHRYDMSHTISSLPDYQSPEITEQIFHQQLQYATQNKI